MSFSDLYFSRKPGALRSKDVSFPPATPPATFTWGSIWGFNPWRARPPTTPPPAVVLQPTSSSLLARRRVWNRNTDHGRKLDPMGWQGSLKDQRRWEEHVQINADCKEEDKWPDEPPSFTNPDWQRSASNSPEEILSPHTVSCKPIEPASAVEEVEWGTWHYNTGMRYDDSFSCSDQSLAFFLGASYRPDTTEQAALPDLDYGDEENVIGHKVNFAIRESQTKNEVAPTTADPPPLLNPEQQSPPFVITRLSTLVLDAADACHTRRGFEDVPPTPVTMDVATSVSATSYTAAAVRLDVAVAMPMTTAKAVRPVTIASR